MKQKLLSKVMFLLFALIAGSTSVWADDVQYYTLEPASGSNNGYADNCDVEIDGITWNITGNSTLQPWRIGGKSIEDTDRAVYSKTAMGSAITKVELEVGEASSITVNSLKLIVASDAGFNTQIDEVSKTFAASSTITFTPTSGTEWATGAYYKFVFNVTVSATKNKFVEFSNAKFYKAEAAPAYTITAESNNESYGTVSLVGTTITANPKPGYRVSTYTVTGTAEVSQDGNTFTVTPSTDCTVQIIFEEIPTHNAVFSVNGITSTQSFAEGATITFPSNPSTTFGKVFKGWSESRIVGTTNEEPTYVTSATMGDADVTYYAVFATEIISEEEVTKTYGFETTSDEDWIIDGPVRSTSYHNSGSYAGRINTNNTYVQFKNKVKVTEFSFAFMRTSNNNNYNVYIEKSSNGSTWTSAETYAMSTFSNGTFNTKTKTFDDKTELYVRFHCNNTTAERFVDDVTIKYLVSSTTYSDYCTTIEYSRTVKAGNYGTICLPRATTAAPEGATFYTVGGTTENGVMLVEHDGALAAGTPYVFKATGTEITATCTGDAADVQAATGLVGNLSATPMDVPTNCYVLSSNLLRKVNGGTATVAQYRAYFDLSKVDKYPSGGASVKAVVLGWNEATGIALPATEKAEKVIFDLSGRRVEKPAKGLYIVNGKKVLF